MGRGTGGTRRLNPEAWALLGRAGLGQAGMRGPSEAAWAGQALSARAGRAGAPLPALRRGRQGEGTGPRLLTVMSPLGRRLPSPVGAGQALPQRAGLAGPGASCRARSTVTVAGSPATAPGTAHRGQPLGPSAEERVGPGWQVLCCCGCRGRGGLWRGFGFFPNVVVCSRGESPLVSAGGMLRALQSIHGHLHNRLWFGLSLCWSCWPARD